MSDLRKDPVSGRWVIIAENRADRPVEFERAPSGRIALRCPFCAGNERDTPPALADYRPPEPDSPHPWQVRVVPNKYPAMDGQRRVFQESIGVYDTMQSGGAHEVIIESPDHCLSPTDLTQEQSKLVYTVYRDRLREASRQRHLAYGMIFKNAGAAAGASLEHLHSQLIATPMVPPGAQIELDHCRQFHRRTGTCLFCAILQHELAAKQRVVAQSARFVAFCPFASRFAYESWILPRAHSSRFEQLGEDDLSELAQLVRHVVGRIESALERPAYNWLLHSAPFDTSAQDHYHWHIEIFPRLAQVAGFELGTGCFINCTSPERAAGCLRGARTRIGP